MNIPRRLANLFGYDLLRIVKYQPTIESHLPLLFKELKIDLVLDVGANNGGYGTMLRKIGYAGHIVSFEPVRRCHDALLERTKNDARWKAFRYALGSRKSELEINVPESDDFSSFLDVAPTARERWSAVFSSVARETVQVEMLDDLFAGIMEGCPGCRNIFLKLDTQGYDLEVLKGAQKVLPRIGGLQSEISLLPIYQGMPDYLESLRLFREHGFGVTGLYPVSRDRKTLQLVEMDCVMRRITLASGRPLEGG